MKSYLIMALPFVRTESVYSTIAVAMGRHHVDSAAPMEGDPARYFRVRSDKTADEVRRTVVEALKRTGCIENLYVADISEVA